MTYLIIQLIFIAFASLAVASFCFVLTCVALKRYLNEAMKAHKVKKLSDELHALYEKSLSIKDEEIRKFSDLVQKQSCELRRQKHELTARRLKVKKSKRPMQLS